MWRKGAEALMRGQGRVQWPFNRPPGLIQLFIHFIVMWHAGGPCGARLEALGLRIFDNASGLEEGRDPQVSASQPLAAVGPGFPAVSKKLVARIRANEYVDFAEYRRRGRADQ